VLQALRYARGVMLRIPLGGGLSVMSSSSSLQAGTSSTVAGLRGARRPERI